MSPALLEKTLEIPVREGRDYLHISDLYYALYDLADENLSQKPVNLNLSMLKPLQKDPVVRLYQGSITNLLPETKATFSFDVNNLPYHFLLSDSSSLTNKTYQLNVEKIAAHCEYINSKEARYMGPPIYNDLHILSTLSRLLFLHNYPQNHYNLLVMKIHSTTLLKAENPNQYKVKLDYVNPMDILKTSFFLGEKNIGGQFIKYLRSK